MKKLLFALLLFSACNKSPERKAADAVSEFIKQNAHDPKSYEPGEFDIRPVTGELPEYDKKKDSLSALMKSNKLSVADWIKQDSALIEQYRDKLVKGWEITHTFRCKNAFGALVASEQNFYVDTAFHVEINEHPF